MTYIGQGKHRDKCLGRHQQAALVVGGRLARGRHQRGAVLAVALIMLVVVTLLGLAAVSGTSLQNKMAANQFDRQLAFQAASSALPVALDALLANPAIAVRNCQTGTETCEINPFDDDNITTNDIQTVATTAYTASEATPGTPQYVIENMGIWVNPKASAGGGQSANASAYGATGVSPTVTYYRITVRSGDPAAIGDHAIVVLQAIAVQ